MVFKDYMFKTRLPLLNKALDAYALRQQTISKNIANISTAGYSPEKVKFEEFFKEANTSLSGEVSEGVQLSMGASAASEAKIEVFTPEVPQNETFFGGTSHVNIDREMSDMAENQIRYRFTSRMVKRFFSGLNTAITGYKE